MPTHPVDPLPAARPPRVRTTDKSRRDTAESCRERAAADLLQSVSMLMVNERRRMESSAASWTARAEMLDGVEARFEARMAAAERWAKPA